jgi:flagellar hook assembly protein FlgD
VPDELKIRIFTIAGRLIKEIVKKSNELNYDFNRIYWNGRDEDGDILANGVYLYKIIMKKGNKTDTFINKIAILR